MVELWFAFALVPFALWVVLDGFDLGAALALPFLARTDAERDEVLQTIGPYWDANEVWLLAGGGTLFLAFPALLGAALSGFYLPVMILVWALMVRGGALELRHHVHEAPWRELLTALVQLSSGAIAFLAAALLGAAVLGVPLGPDGTFALGLFSTESGPGALSFTTAGIGLLGVASVAVQGAFFVAPRVSAPVAERAYALARRALAVAGVLFGLLLGRFLALFPELVLQPSSFALLTLAVMGAVVAFAAASRRSPGLGLGSASLWLLGLTAVGPLARYPVLLASTEGEGLTARAVAAPEHSLTAAAPWWPLAVIVAAAWFAVVVRVVRRTTPPSTTS
ncbi:MAG: cytochrome d ubiquinol oxidase subunit II [Myxococcaceae bacterium]|nr:cytochrome d ubiquinol oxidase subunit II [Myxococcaceae bacterium]